MFAREDGSDVSPEAVTQTFGRLATAAGLRSMRLHDLRHVATSLIAGVPVHVVADRLGHADAAITLRVYAHVLHDDAARVADVFVQALGLRDGSA